MAVSSAAVASAKSKRNRQRRNPQTAPRAVASDRRTAQARRQAQRTDAHRRASRRLGVEGERPRSIFGPVPVAEVAILAGLIAAVIGFVSQTPLTLIVGLIVCGLGVMEVTGREHFSGYRSHTTLLAGLPAIAVEAGVVYAFGDPHHRQWLLAIIVPVFVALFFPLRKRFEAARQARVARAARGISG